jgi:aerobic carbon-monoxide dehydrogenase medium subunit
VDGDEFIREGLSMYPAPFEYSAPATIDEAIALLAKHGEGAKLLAGGHSLLPLLKLRFAQPAHVVDLRRIASLQGIRRDAHAITVGSMTTHTTIAASPDIRELFTAVAEAASRIGDPQVRNRGTIGGSLAHADPAADLPAAMLAVDAQIVAAGPLGRRVIDAQDFFVGMLTSALRPDEVLAEIRLPLPIGKAGSAYEKEPHPASRFAVVGIAAALILDGQRRIADARVAVTGFGTVAVRSASAESFLLGNAADAATFDVAAAAVVHGIEPREDSHAKADYKKELARLLAVRALSRAAERAG